MFFDSIQYSNTSPRLSGFFELQSHVGEWAFVSPRMMSYSLHGHLLRSSSPSTILLDLRLVSDCSLVLSCPSYVDGLSPLDLRTGAITVLLRNLLPILSLSGSSGSSGLSLPIGTLVDLGRSLSVMSSSSELAPPTAWLLPDPRVGGTYAFVILTFFLSVVGTSISPFDYISREFWCFFLPEHCC